MNKQSSEYWWIGWVAAIVIGLVFVIYIFNSNSGDESIVPSETTSATSQPATGVAPQSEPAQEDTSWHCVDATSYNQNAYDDNRCTNGTETKYVSDSQAVGLDPNYTPGKSGASYYNNR